MSLGAWLFRHRSFTPVPVIVLGVLACWRDAIDPGPGGEQVDLALNVLGVALVASGWLVRFLTVGFAPHGAQTRILSANQLCTTGPYAFVRHPLYLGNGLIVLGLLSIVHRWQAWLLGGLFFVVAWGLIIAAEEALLRARFGAAWVEWASAVPAVWPTWRAQPRWDQPFEVRLALRRELTPLGSCGLGVCLLLGWEWWARARLTDARALGLELTLGLWLVLLVGNKVWKKMTP